MNRFTCLIAVILLTSPWLIAGDTSQPSAGTMQPADPDADLRALNDFDIHRKMMIGDDQYWNLIETVGKLNTQRTFDIVVKRLDSKDMFEREQAVRVIAAYKLPGCVPALVNELENDPKPQLQYDAAQALIHFADDRAEPALVKAVRSKNSDIAWSAAMVLATMQSDAGFQPTLDLLDRPDFGGDAGEWDIAAVALYHRKQSVVALLKQYARIKALPDGDGYKSLLIQRVEWDLKEFGEVTTQQLGPTPDTLEQWNEWWAQAEPMLDDRMQLKDKPVVTVNYVDADFRQAPEAIELRAKLDAAEYRIGDPMRLDLEMENHSKNPYSLILPKPPSGWYPTMAYGIHLTRGGQVVFDIPPSDFYIGSYSGPPDFETLKPGETFKSSISLWYWLRGDLDLPLQEGDYDLTISFDSSKYAGVQAGPTQLIHRWDAKPIKFHISGPARKDPDELIKLISQKAGLKWLTQDIGSPQEDRRSAAWAAIYYYGDSRLESFVKEHAGVAPTRWYDMCNSDLAPFEAKKNRIMPQ